MATDLPDVSVSSSLNRDGVRKAILDALASAAPAGVLGATLGTHLRRRFSDLNFIRLGTANMRAFIEQFVPEARRQTRQGGDVLYSIGEPVGVAGVVDSQVPVASPWRAWVSPGFKAVLLIDRMTGDVTVAKSANHDESKFIALPPHASSGHFDLARQFLKQDDLPISPETRDKLEHILTAGQPTWWKDYRFALRAESRDAEHQWLHFRADAITVAFRDALVAKGMKSDLAEVAAQKLRSPDGRQTKLEAIKAPLPLELPEGGLEPLVKLISGQLDIPGLRALTILIARLVDRVDGNRG